MNKTDSLLIGFNFDYHKGTGILIVGKKEHDKDVSIINVFQGKEATELYKKLTTERNGEIK